jgi:transcription initiation factor IIF auxiliary subunit
MSLILDNNSSYASKKGKTDWWNWSAFINATPPDSLDDIEYVEYHLHPTFRNPVRRVFTKEDGFALKTGGWGVFELKAKVVFKDAKKSPEILTHYLNFEGSVPQKR